MKNNISLAVVGHIDHGKSTFIGRLLYDVGYIKTYEVAAMKEETGCEKLDFSQFLDVYKEERENSMTMDTTKRYFETDNYRATIIDCPGHQEFIKNMLSGASEAEGAIALVSCSQEEGVQEQGKRHLALLTVLNIPINIIAVNKTDEINYSKERFDEVVKELKAFLETLGQNTENIEFIPVSAKEGDNVHKKSANTSWYTGPTVTEAIGKLNKKKEETDKVLRLTVQQVDPEEKIIFGRIEAGKIKVGQNIEFGLANTITKVEKIATTKEGVSEASKGEVVSLTVNNIENINRGDIAGEEGKKPEKSNTVLAEVILPHNTELKIGDRFTFRYATAETEAIVNKIVKKINSEDLSFIENDPLAVHEGEIGMVRIGLIDDLVLEEYKQCPSLGRFVGLNQKKSFPGIIVKKEDNEERVTKIACGISPTTLPQLDELTKQKRVSLLRVNGAFPLPDWEKIKSFGLPIGLDIPGDRSLRNKPRTTPHTDDELIDIAIKEGLDYVSLSYVTDAIWTKEVQQRIKEKQSKTQVIAKIETAEALKHLRELIDAADKVLIDRGDLGEAIGFEKVAFYQDKIIEETKKKGKEIMIATEIAASTINTYRPSHADSMQIREFAKKKVDFIVLAEETTKSQTCIEAVKSINRVLDYAEIC